MIIDFSNLGGGSPSSLPIATTATTGVVKIGSGVTVDSAGTISVDVPEVEQDYKIVSAITDYSAGKMYAVVSPAETTIVSGNPETNIKIYNDVYIRGQIADTSEGYSFNPWIRKTNSIYIDIYVDKQQEEEKPTLVVKYGSSTVLQSAFTGNSIIVSLPDATGNYAGLSGITLIAAIEEDNYLSVELQGSALQDWGANLPASLTKYNVNIQNVVSEIEGSGTLERIVYTDGSNANNIYMLQNSGYVEIDGGSDDMHQTLRVVGMAAKDYFDYLNEGDVMAYKYQMGWIFDDANNGFYFNYAKDASGWWIGDIYPIHIGYSGDTQINLRLISNGDGYPQYVDIYRGDNPDDKIERLSVESWELPTTLTANNYDLKVYLERTTGDTYNTASFINFAKASDDTPIELDFSDADLNETIVSDLYKKTASGWTKVVDIPVASSNTAGIVKVGEWGGLTMDGNEIQVKSLPQKSDVNTGQIANVSFNSVGNWINSGSSANTYIIDLTYVPLELSDINFSIMNGSFRYNGSEYQLGIQQIDPVTLRYQVTDDSWSTIFTATTSGDGVYNVAASEAYEATITVDGNLVTVELTNSDISDIRFWYENMPVLVLNINNQKFPVPVRPKLGTGLKYNSNGEIVLA